MNELSMNSPILKDEKRLAALLSVMAGTFLVGMKLTVGLLTGSLGILSEALHSGFDLIAAVITFIAVHISACPPDEKHLYGHGKVENISALTETLLLLATCFWIIYESVHRILCRNIVVEVNAFSLGIMIVSVVVDIMLSRHLYRVSHKHSSEALEADALHYASDIYSSLLVLAGLAFVKLGWPMGDSLAALGVAIMVIIASLRLGKQSLDTLLDRAPSGLASKLETAVRGVDGVLDVQQLRIRRSGKNIFVDLRVPVGRNLSFEKSHEITTSIEERICQLAPGADVIVHTDPTETSHETMSDRIFTIANKHQLTVHNLSFHSTKDQVGIDLHIEVDSHLNLRQAHALASQLEGDIYADLPAITEINTHIESRRTNVNTGEDITASSDEIVKQVKDLTKKVSGLKNAHHIVVRRINHSLSISLHCICREELSIEAVHEASSRLEMQLRQKIPLLERVIIHAEPQARKKRG